MKIIEAGRDQSLVSLSLDDLYILKGVFNEVLNAMPTDEFHTHVGADLQDGWALYNKIKDLLTTMSTLGAQETY